MQTTIKHIYLRANVQPFGDKISPYIVGITKNALVFFDEYNFQYAIEDFKLTNQEINDYVEQCSWRNIPLPNYFLKKILKYYLKNVNF